jgi:glutathione S-transferase
MGVSIERMETLLEKSRWLAGPTYSLADINSYSMVAGVPRFFPEFMRPRTTEWLAEMNARPAVQAALAMPNKVPETLRAFGN